MYTIIFPSSQILGVRSKASRVLAGALVGLWLLEGKGCIRGRCASRLLLILGALCPLGLYSKLLSGDAQMFGLEPV